MANSRVESPLGRLSGRLRRDTTIAVRRDVVPVRHWGRMIGAAITLVLVVAIFYTIVSSPHLQWALVSRYLFDGAVLSGLIRTLVMTVLGSVIAIVLAIVIGVMRTSSSLIVSAFAAAWVFVFRGVPLIVLLIMIGNIGLFAPQLRLAVPFTDLVLWSVPANEVVTPFVASVAGLALAGSGYMAEVVRAGLLSVGGGQHEAAKSLGLNGARTLRYVILPQALRVMLPPLGNEVVGMLKASAIVSVIGGGDLLTILLGYSSVNFATIEMLIVATIWYLSVIAALSVGQKYIEHTVRER